MAARPLSPRAAAPVALVSIFLVGSVAERQGGRLAVVVQHHHMQRAAPAPAAARGAGGAADDGAGEGGGQKEALAMEVERLNRTLMEDFHDSGVQQDEARIKQRLKAVRALHKIGKRTGGARALLPAVPGLALALTKDHSDNVRMYAALALGEAGPDAAERATPALLLSACNAGASKKRADDKVGVAAVASLLKLWAAERALPFLLRVVQESEAARVRKTAVDAVIALPQWPGSEATERTLSVMLWAATIDPDVSVRTPAEKYLQSLGTTNSSTVEAARRIALNLSMMVVRDRDGVSTVSSMDSLASREVDAATPSMPMKSHTERRLALKRSKSWQLSLDDLGDLVAPLFRRVPPSNEVSAVLMADVRVGYVILALTRLVEFFRSLDAAALKQVVPTLAQTLDAVQPYMQVDWPDKDRCPLPCQQGDVRGCALEINKSHHNMSAAISEGTVCMSGRLASEFAAEVGSALAKVASEVAVGTLNILTQAEESAAPYGSASVTIGLVRKIVRATVQAKCAASFREKTRLNSYISNLTVYMLRGVMIVSGDNGLQAHKCANPYACPSNRKQRLSLAKTNSSTEFKKGSCPLQFLSSPGSSNESTVGSTPMCAPGYDPASRGCTKCSQGFGRKATDPFICKRCSNFSQTETMVTVFAQPLLIFLISLRSANLATSRGTTELLANDVLKIGLAYVSSISVVVSTVTASDAYRELNAKDRSKKLLKWTRKESSRGDITYSESMDCLIMKGEGLASVDSLLVHSLKVPTCIIAVAAVWTVVRACWRSVFSGGTLGSKEVQAEVVTRMMAGSLVAGNQFLPCVVSASMRALPCFHTQVASDEKDPMQFMMYDPDAKCYETYVEFMASTEYLSTCGSALAFAFAAGPVYWLTLLRRTTTEQAGPLRFLTGSYRDDFHWWEAGRLCKSMLIAAVVTASPASYCPLQQLMLCLIITVTYGFWHCANFPYKNFLLNAAEAGSLLTLSASMGLSGLLAGAGWELTPGFRSIVIVGIMMMLILYFLALVGLWVKFKFFWSEDPDEELLAARSRDGAQRDGNTG